MNKENNILIADFMGFIESTIKGKFWDKKSEEGFGEGKLTDLKFNSSWDWLMPVVEKIESLGYLVDIKSMGCKLIGCGYSSVELIHIEESNSNNKIEAVCNAVIEFIKWYNESGQKE